MNHHSLTHLIQNHGSLMVSPVENIRYSTIATSMVKPLLTMKTYNFHVLSCEHFEDVRKKVMAANRQVCKLQELAPRAGSTYALTIPKMHRIPDGVNTNLPGFSLSLTMSSLLFVCVKSV